MTSTISKLKRVGASRNSFLPPRCYRIVKTRADNQTRTTADPLPDDHPNALIKTRADSAHQSEPSRAETVLVRQPACVQASSSNNDDRQRSASRSDSGARCRALVVPPLPGGLFGGASETGNTAPGLGFGQGASRGAQAFADVLTESEARFETRSGRCCWRAHPAGCGLRPQYRWVLGSWVRQIDRAYGVRVVEASCPGRLGPMPRCRSGCRLILGRVESAEADLELVVAQWWLQHRGDELIT